MLYLLELIPLLTHLGSNGIYKQEALVYIRLGRFPEALASLQSYIDKLNEEYIKVEEMKNESFWESIIQYLESEINWTKIMIYKVKKM